LIEKLFVEQPLLPFTRYRHPSVLLY